MIALERRGCQIDEKLLHAQKAHNFRLIQWLNTIHAYDMLLNVFKEK
jgi:hypothetical protein